jgi:AraC-like DNA-binding protein
LDHHAIPELAISSFERLHGLTVTVHDLVGTLAPFLLPERARHRHPRCVAFRDSGHQHFCVGFDVARLRQDAEWLRDGRLQRCPAGLVEWVVPLFHGPRLGGMLFAGVVAPTGLDALLGVTAKPVGPTPTGLTVVAPQQAEAVLEALRQLAARLQAWLASEHATPLAATPSRVVESRRATIRQFISEHYAENIGLPDLAQHLGLSPSRAGAVVLAACGESFVTLLTRARLISAVDLLHHTDLPVADIALRCGFGDPSHFFKVFRREYGLTPLAVRRQGGVPGRGA